MEHFFSNFSNFFYDIFLISLFFLILGYHQCTKEEAVTLAALIYRVKYSESKQELQMLPQMLRELVPTDLIKQLSTTDWKREIIKCYNQDSGISPEDAKIAFLKVIYR